MLCPPKEERRGGTSGQGRPTSEMPAEAVRAVRGARRPLGGVRPRPERGPEEPADKPPKAACGRVADGGRALVKVKGSCSEVSAQGRR